MTRSEEIVRIVTASMATVFAAFFVSGYNYVKYHNAVVHHHAELPTFTLWVVSGVSWAFLVPVLVLILGLVFLKRHMIVTVIVSLAWLFSLGWPLLCIVVWEFPFVLL
jgi:hypothetical protein